MAVACLSAVNSLRARGLRRTLPFATLGCAIPFLGELLGIHVLRLLRHRVRPQVGGVLLAVALGWYSVGYNAYVLTEHALERDGLRRGQLVASVAALGATGLDTLLDPCGLNLGLWEWGCAGPYAEIEGPNGKHVIPALNFACWITLISGVALAFRRLASGASRAAVRGPALLLLPYYLPAAWAIRRRRFGCLVYCVPSAAMMVAALKNPPDAS